MESQVQSGWDVEGKTTFVIYLLTMEKCAHEARRYLRFWAWGSGLGSIPGAALAFQENAESHIPVRNCSSPLHFMFSRVRFTVEIMPA